MAGAATDVELRAEAARFLARHDRRGADVHLVEEQAPGIYWLLYVVGKEARRAIVAGAEVKDWELIDDEPGWPA